jgi:very-short-patch-repair endonuclease
MATSNLKKQILTPYAKSLRRNATQAEKVLSRQLRARQLEGIKFRRQQPIDGYIVDFVSFETRLVIELDGGKHAVNRKKDIERRDKYMKDRNENRPGYKKTTMGWIPKEWFCVPLFKRTHLNKGRAL